MSRKVWLRGEFENHDDCVELGIG
jgi:hypothetical protein